MQPGNAGGFQAPNTEDSENKGKGGGSNGKGYGRFN